MFEPFEAFSLIDTDKKGKITVNDIHNLLEDANSQESIARFVAKYDINNNESLNY